MDKLRKYRKGIMFFLKILITLSALTIFMYALFEYYSQATYANKGNFIVAFLYFVVFLTFSSTYNCFMIGILRLRELVASYCIAIFFTNAIFYFVMSLIARAMLGLVPIFLISVVQSIVAMLLYVEANRIYFKLYPARDCVVVCSDNPGDLLIVEKFIRIKERYNIKLVCNESDGFDAIIEKINKHSTAILGSISNELRSRLIKYCYEHSIRLFVVPTIEDILLNKAHETQIGDSLVYLIKNRSFSLEQLAIKRMMDIFISLVAIIITSPIMIVTAAAIKIYDDGPVFFKQIRYTRNKETFEMIKFRSMIPDAEKDGARYTTPGDERITPVGKFIRRTRIDELPQFFNVLKGDMSVVGPRAERIETVDAYCEKMPEFAYRMKVKAGITGYAQIYGKYNTTYEEKVKMDLLYIENSSLLLDIQLMFSTFKVLVRDDSTEGFEDSKIDGE